MGPENASKCNPEPKLCRAKVKPEPKPTGILNSLGTAFQKPVVPEDGSDWAQSNPENDPSLPPERSGWTSFVYTGTKVTEKNAKNEAIAHQSGHCSPYNKEGTLIPDNSPLGCPKSANKDPRNGKHAWTYS